MKVKDSKAERNRKCAPYPAALFLLLADVFTMSPFARTAFKEITLSRIVPYLQ
jgi:hypothetical protein